MISHISLKVSDIEKAKAFYTKALEPLGYKVKMDYAEYKMAGLADAKGNTDFWLDGNGWPSRAYT